MSQKTPITATTDPATGRDDLALPETELAAAVLAYVSSAEPAYLLNHSIRSYLFGKSLGQRSGLHPGRDYDHDVMFLSCLLHDIGLTEEANGDQRFEVDGADRAAAFAREHGFDQIQSDLVWDAVALHTSIGIASRKRPEIALTHAGIGADILGFGAGGLPEDLVRDAHVMHPRLGLEAEVAHVVREQCAVRPAKAPPFTFAATVVNEHGDGHGVPGYAHLVEKSPWGGIS